MIIKITPPNREWYLNRCTELEKALGHKRAMPPFLIFSLCQSVMVRVAGGPWRVIWYLFLDRLEHLWNRIKSNSWDSWRRYILLETQDEIMEAYHVWLEKETGHDDREWPDEIFDEETTEQPSI